MVRTILDRSMIAVLAAGLSMVAWVAPPGVAHAAPIRPGQYFLGTVNGDHTQPVVQVICPGPVGGDRTGPPIADQPLGVLRVGAGQDRGYTGAAARAIVVVFVDDTSEIVRLDQYGVTKPIPTSLAFPCEGTGVVRFRSVPVTSSSVPDEIKVTYQNIAD
jgi:hypothetical protein